MIDWCLWVRLGEDFIRHQKNNYAVKQMVRNIYDEYMDRIDEYKKDLDGEKRMERESFIKMEATRMDSVQRAWKH